jgi:outer membrane biosynthesis protein TonB
MSGRNDEFDEESFLDSVLNKKGKSGTPPLFRLLAVVAALAVVGAVGAVVWVTSSDRGEVLSEADVPVIRADASPYKIKPDDPGGMAVPNKDSTIFDTIKGDRREAARVENLLEDNSEEPVKKEEVFSPDAQNVPDQPPDDVEEVRVEEEEPEVKAESKPEEKKPEPVPESAPEPAKAKAEEKPVPAKTESGNFYVQLASVKSEAEAKAQWTKLQNQFSELSGLTLRVQKADLGAKGVFYRVQGGGVSEAEARKICAAINARKAGGCLVAK